MDYIKVAGKFEKVLTPYIKVQGKWKESLKEYIKVGGKWADTSDLGAVKLDYDMTQSKEADSTRYFVNKENPTTHKAVMQSGNGISLVAGERFDVPIVAGTKSIIYYSVKDKKFKKVITLTGTKYSITESFNNAVRVDSKVVVDADLTYLDAHPDALGEMFFGKAHPGLSFTKADMTEYYPCNEGKGDANELVGSTTKPIIGTWVKTLNNGMQNFFFKQDAHGKLIGLAKDGTIESHTGPDLRTGEVKSFGSVIIDNGNGTFTLTYKKGDTKALQFDVSDDSQGSRYMEWEIVSMSHPFSFYRWYDGTNSHMITKSLHVGMNKFSDIGARTGSGYVALYPNKDTVNDRTITFKQPTFIATDGRWIDLPLVDNTKKHHLVTKCLQEIKGDITSVVDVKCTP